MNKKICNSCQYCRSHGWMDTGIPGIGEWCSNSKSPKFSTRVLALETCDEYYQRGKKAPLALRVVNKLLSRMNYGR